MSSESIIRNGHEKRLNLLCHLADKETMVLSLPSEGKRGDNADAGWCELIVTTSHIIYLSQVEGTCF